MGRGVGMWRRVFTLGVSLIGAWLIAGCSAGPASGELQLVVADQTTQNPIRDVVEVEIPDGSTIYPDSASGGSPVAAGKWTTGETLTVTIWPNADDEPMLSVSMSFPADIDPGTVSLVIEIEDNTVRARSAAIQIDESFERYNPVQEQALAEERKAQEELDAAEAAADAAKKDALDAVIAIRREAKQLDAEMRKAQTDLNEVLDEHATVYGDDDWASFKQIARKYGDYTTEALGTLQDSVPNSVFVTDEVSDANAAWQRWWNDFIQVHSRNETAARNNDSTAMDAARADENELWDQWRSMFDVINSLRSLRQDG